MPDYEPYKIFEFGEVFFFAEQLLSLPAHRLEFITRSGLAANDVAIFLRLFRFHFHRDSGSEIMDEIQALNGVVVQRNLLAKLFEFIKVFEHFKVQCRRKKDVSLSVFLDAALAPVAELKAHKAYDVMEKARNDVTNHYVTTKNEEHLRNYTPGQRLKMYLHMQTGNSYYPVAEEISYLAHISHTDSDGVSVEDILDWGREAAHVLLQHQQKLTIEIFKAGLPDLRSRNRRVFVPNRLVGDEHSRAPILIKTQD